MEQKAITIAIGEFEKYKTINDYLAVLNKNHWILDSFSYLPIFSPSDPIQVTIIAHHE